LPVVKMIGNQYLDVLCCWTHDAAPFFSALFNAWTIITASPSTGQSAMMRLLVSSKTHHWAMPFFTVYVQPRSSSQHKVRAMCRLMMREVVAGSVVDVM